MPVAVLRAYTTMLPRLRAQESLSAATTVAVGGGTVAAETSSRILASWRRQAQATGRRRLPPGPFVQMSPGAASAFAVRRVTVRRPTGATSHGG